MHIVFSAMGEIENSRWRAFGGVHPALSLWQLMTWLYNRNTCIAISFPCRILAIAFESDHSIHAFVSNLLKVQTFRIKWTKEPKRTDAIVEKKNVSIFTIHFFEIMLLKVKLQNNKTVFISFGIFRCNFNYERDAVTKKTVHLSIEKWQIYEYVYLNIYIVDEYLECGCDDQQFDANDRRDRLECFNHLWDRTRVLRTWNT